MSNFDDYLEYEKTRIPTTYTKPKSLQELKSRKRSNNFFNTEYQEYQRRRLPIYSKRHHSLKTEKKLRKFPKLHEQKVNALFDIFNEHAKTAGRQFSKSPVAISKKKNRKTKKTYRRKSKK